MPQHQEQNFRNEPLKNLRHNIHNDCGQEVVRVQADIDREIYDYFFHHVIAYTHGARQAVISFFFQRFYEACRQAGMPAVWDEDNTTKILAILNRLNFNEQPNYNAVLTHDNFPRHVLD